MITSRQNERLKDIRRFRRCKGDQAVLEGPHLIREAANAGIELEMVLATTDFLAGDAARELLPALSWPPLEVAPGLLASVTDSDSPRGIVAVARLPRGGVDQLTASADGVYLFVDGLQDPGNLGALARVAEAASVVGLCLSLGCVHPNHPRALRASAGSLLRLPIARRATARQLDERLRSLSPRWMALMPRGGADLFQQSWTGTVVVALGAEGVGLGSQALRQAGATVTIPVDGEVESLNATVAAAIVLFEIRRQRSAERGTAS